MNRGRQRQQAVNLQILFQMLGEAVQNRLDPGFVRRF